MFSFLQGKVDARTMEADQRVMDWVEGTGAVHRVFQMGEALRTANLPASTHWAFIKDIAAHITCSLQAKLYPG